MLSKEVMLARETEEDIGVIIHKNNFLAILHKKNYTSRITFRILQWENIIKEITPRELYLGSDTEVITRRNF